MKRLKQWHQLKAQSKKSELPETGGEESTNKGILFGGLFSILGFALLRRNKRITKHNQSKIDRFIS